MAPIPEWRIYVSKLLYFSLSTRESLINSSRPQWVKATKKSNENNSAYSGHLMQSWSDISERIHWTHLQHVNVHGIFHIMFMYQTY